MPPAKRSANRLPRDAYTLTVRQTPEAGKSLSGKEKDRKPVDPPPIVQLQIRDYNDRAQNWLQSPYYMCLCSLWDPVNDEAAQDPTLVGTLVSSLHRLKDSDNSDAGFFVFPDLSVKAEGEFRLKFVLWEILEGETESLQSIISKPFRVHPSKTFPGLAESTFLTRSFSDQGVRLRIRKETRTAVKRPQSDADNGPYGSPTDGPGMSHGPYGHGNPYHQGGYGVDYSQSMVKRQKSAGSSGYSEREGWYAHPAQPSPGLYGHPSNMQQVSSYYQEGVSGAPQVDYGFRTSAAPESTMPQSYYQQRGPIADYGQTSQALPYHQPRATQADGSNGVSYNDSFGSMPGGETPALSPPAGRTSGVTSGSGYRYGGGTTLPPISTAATGGSGVLASSPGYAYGTDGRYTSNGMASGRPAYGGYPGQAYAAANYT